MVCCPSTFTNYVNYNSVTGKIFLWGLIASVTCIYRLFSQGFVTAQGQAIRYYSFLHDRPWMSPWIKSISNELDITCHVFASQLPSHCDVIANPLWRHQQNVKRARETRGWCVKILVLASFMDSLCRVRNKIMYVHLWRTVYTLTRVLFWCLFPSLLCNSGNKHQNNPLVSA